MSNLQLILTEYLIDILVFKLYNGQFLLIKKSSNSLFILFYELKIYHNYMISINNLYVF